MTGRSAIALGLVIPAQAGIHATHAKTRIDSRLRGNDGNGSPHLGSPLATTKRFFLASIAVVILQCVIGASAHAHSVGTSYVQVSENDSGAVHTRVDVSLQDLEFAVGLDADGDARITWGEVLANAPAVTAYLQRSLVVARGEQSCTFGAPEVAIDTHADELYAVFDMSTSCSGEDALRVQSSLLFELDDSHRSLLTVNDDNNSLVTVLTNDAREWTQGASLNAWHSYVTFVGQGVWHIWIGFDHLAFLMLLLLPLARETNASTAKQATQILKVVTAFTVAHSITLICAALGILELPSRWVEAAIAASIVIAAVTNLLNVAARYSIAMAFGFGLIHGVGFAGALADIATDTQHRVLALFGFNLGVELGQLVVVAAVFPILFLWQSPSRIRQRAMVAGSAVMGMLGVAWLLQRTVLG